MKVNFDIIDNHSVAFEKRLIDLHNNFDFVGFNYNIVEREIKLYWIKSIGIWVDKNEFSGLVLTHKSVNYLKVVDQDENSTLEDDACLGEITFSPSTMREMNDSIIPKSKPDEKDDILYLFENGARIRIHCEQILLNLQI